MYTHMEVCFVFDPVETRMNTIVRRQVLYLLRVSHWLDHRSTLTLRVLCNGYAVALRTSKLFADYRSVISRPG